VIVLDTHAWIWLASEPERLGREARRLLRRERVRGVPAISCWEVAALAARGRLELDRDLVAWMEDALSETGSDRLIVATALTHGAVLVAKDERIREHGAVRTAW